MTTKAQPLLFRLATEADLSTIVHLLADDTLGAEREQDITPLPLAYYQAFSEIAQDPNNELVVAELQQRVVGTAQLTFIPSLTFTGGKRLLVEAVYIDSNFRGQQLGRQLFEWIIARARQQHCRIVQLTTNAQRTDAHRFYYKLGFESTHVGMKLHLF